MIKIKFSSPIKEQIRQRLKLDDSINLDIVVSSSPQDAEADAINLIVDAQKLEDVVVWLEHYKRFSGIQLLGRNPRGESLLNLFDIIHIESFGNDVIATLSKGEFHLNLKLYQLEEELQSEGFIRISKSMIINTAHIESIYSGFNGKLVLTMSHKKPVEVNRSYTKTFKHYFNERK